MIGPCVTVILVAAVSATPNGELNGSPMRDCSVSCRPSGTPVGNVPTPGTCTEKPPTPLKSVLNVGFWNPSITSTGNGFSATSTMPSTTNSEPMPRLPWKIAYGWFESPLMLKFARVLVLTLLVRIGNGGPSMPLIVIE